MGATSNVDTPDYQRGIVNPQTLLAQLPRGTQSVTVTVPPNAENLVVTTWGGLLDYDISCAGVTSHFGYAGQLVGPTAFVNASPTYIFDVSNAFDEQVTIAFRTAPNVQWAVYSDAGIHTVLDLNKAVDGQGNTYVITTVPGDGNGDHPDNELTVASAYLGDGGVLLAGPGAGKRYRVFAAQLIPTNGSTLNCYLYDTGTGVAFCGGVGPYPSTLQIPLTGLPLTTNAGIEMGTNFGAGTALAVVIYRLETL